MCSRSSFRALLASRVHENGQGIQQGTREVADGTVHLSQHTDAQASTLEETAASIEETNKPEESPGMLEVLEDQVSKPPDC